jgi:hypothetical protein
MNMANTHSQEPNFDYQVNFGRNEAKDKNPREQRFQYSRSNRPAVSHNGIHRRRNKRFSW